MLLLRQDSPHPAEALSATPVEADVSSVDLLINFLPPLVVLLVFGGLLAVLSRTMDRGGPGRPGAGFRRQLVLLGVTGLGLLLLLVTIPIPGDLRDGLLGIFGLLVTVAIAFSATTFVANAMAGVMSRAVRNFKPGDFIRVGEHFGRVTERELFHTEIQTEDRDLTTLPNLFLVTNPVTVIRASGTILAANVGLGYDVPRDRIEELLIEAANETGLKDPFVHIIELQDHAVVYRVAGLLEDVKQMLSCRSRLRGEILDALHDARIEIVSPSFMNQRVSSEPTPAIPQRTRKAPGESSADVESVAFDKADEAESLESLRANYARLEEEIAAAEAAGDGEGDAKAPPEAHVKRLRRSLEVLAAHIEAYERKLEEEHEA
ncbi:MAG: mechanosensitive ion channel domain-containing protein [Planctomycetota bacterium]